MKFWKIQTGGLRGIVWWSRTRWRVGRGERERKRRRSLGGGIGDCGGGGIRANWVARSWKDVRYVVVGTESECVLTQHDILGYADGSVLMATDMQF